MLPLLRALVACAMLQPFAPAFAPALAQWPLGTYVATADVDPNCPPGYTCQGFRVESCPTVDTSARGFIAVRDHAAATARGLVVFTTGGGGGGWWTAQMPQTYALAEDLRAQGFVIAQVRWVDQWLVSSPGDNAGIAHLGCRPATVFRYIHDTYYVPLGLNRKIGEAGFAVTGNSGGSSQIGYALSHFGLDSIIDVAVPSGGPPHAALVKSMLANPGQEAYQYPLPTRQFIDEGFGYFDGNGPGAVQDPTYAYRWLEESHSTGGNDYVHPSTRVRFLIGSQDAQQQAVAGDYVNALAAAGTPMLAREIVAGTPHAVYSTAEGRTAIRNALLPPTPASGSFCFGDGTDGPCPCRNEGGFGKGCGNSAHTGGALLGSSGNASLAADTLQLSVTGELPSALTIFLQGDQQIAPAPFGDGLRCIGGALKRLRTENASGGAAIYPSGGETAVSLRSAQLGDPIAPGEMRSYQTYYRDANTTHCPSPAGSTFNSSNGREVSWSQ